MQIAIDVSQIVYEGTGVANYTLNLTKHLLQLDTRHEFILYAGVLKRRKDLDKLRHLSPWNLAAWKIRPIPPKLAHRLFNKTNIPIDPLIGKFDLFHASDWTHPRTAKPSISTVHDLVFKKYPKFLNKEIVQVQAARLKRLLITSSHIIADSKSTKNDLVKSFAVDPDRITTIYLGYEDIFYKRKKSEIEQVKIKYKIKNDYILCLATKEPRKNLQTAIEAFQSLKLDNTYANLSLVIAGKYGWGKRLHTVSNDIRETGFIERQDLPALLSGAKVFLYPSLYEGFGLPVLEAMACEVPVITSDRSSLPEVVGDAGLLIDPLDTYAIVKAMKKALRRQDLYSKKSKNQAKKFSWDITARKTLQVYENVYNANRAR